MANASGIDVSLYQGKVDWSAVRAAGIEFAFAKATEGTSIVDPQFSANWPGMKAAGVKRGAYHFFVASEDAKAQASHFVATVGEIGADDLAPVIDVESGSPTAAQVQEWLDDVEHQTGRTPMIYTGVYFANEHLGSGFGRYPLWLAAYGVSQPQLPNGWSSWTFWQHSDAGNVSGVDGAVDLDYHNGPLGSEPAPSQPTHSTTSSGQTYTVQAGDTLSTIAARHGTTVDAIAKANNISDPNLIDVGQVLTIP